MPTRRRTNASRRRAGRVLLRAALLPAALLPAAFLLLAAVPAARAAERITLRNGFTLDCLYREPAGEKIRLYTDAGSAHYMEVSAASVVSIETIPDPPAPTPATTAPPTAELLKAELTKTEVAELLAHAGVAHNIDADLLAAVVRAESGGHARAVSRAGAQGLMQLMPGTAAALGVADAFAPAQNVEGGSKYLDQLLTRYKDNIALALAAYNAGPGAVDRYHGVPPFRETRAYVAGIIREFNRRKLTLLASSKAKPPAGK